MGGIWKEVQCTAPVIWLCGVVFSTPFLWASFLYLVWSDAFLRPLLLSYLAWTVLGPGRRAAATGSWRPRLRRARLFTHLADYFPARLHKTADLDPNKKYLFGFAPHGLVGTSVWCCFATEAAGFSQLFPGIDVRIGTIRWNFYTPLAREALLGFGFFCADRHDCLRMLERCSILLVLGGAAEALHTERGCYDLVLKKRKGFAKVALKAGANLVPVLGFGENDLFQRAQVPKGSLLWRLQTLSKQIAGFTLPLAYGRGLFGLRWGILPERVPLNVVVGAPIEVPRYTGSLRSEEGRALVERYHQQYMAALQRLWDDHKEEFAPDRQREMRFVE